MNKSTRSIASITSLAACATLAAAILCGASSPQNAPPSPVLALVEQYLGPGVLGPPVAAAPITTPSDYLASAPTRMTFQLFDDGGDSPQPAGTEVEEFGPFVRAAAGQAGEGADSGQSVQSGQSGQVGQRGQGGLPGQPEDGASTGRSWALRAGDRVVSYLVQGDDGNISRVSSFDAENAVISRFSPPELVIPAGIAPGQSMQRTIAVTVSDLTSPDTVKYQGSLDQTVTYVGTYQVTVPAGTFEAILIDVRFEGKVGPATIHDQTCVLFAKGVGRVAAVEHKSISAFFFYNKDERHGRVLLRSEPLTGAGGNGNGTR